jgi:hypothetical protein
LCVSFAVLPAEPVRSITAASATAKPIVGAAADQSSVGVARSSSQ